MEYKDFAEAMRNMVKDNGKDKLLGDKVRGIVLDYKGQFDTEATIFLKLLDEGCAKFINEADNVLERKRQLAERMEEKHAISPKHSMPLLDLLGFLLKGDTTKCQEQKGDDPNDKGDAAWDRKDYDEAFKWYCKAAEQGHAGAQYSLGNCYYYGQGVPMDFVKAAEWWQKSAEQGNAQAQNTLGMCYLNGNGVTKDDAKSFEWTRKSAEQGDANGQCRLGNHYFKGMGVPKDYAKALEWYRKSVDQGGCVAQYKLGNCYETGEGVPQDYAKAAEWYSKAAEQGLASAQKALDKLKSKGKI